MCKISYAGHRFPPDVIQRAVWLYLRFALSYRDVEDLLAERGLDVSYETVRRWVLKFGRLAQRRDGVVSAYATGAPSRARASRIADASTLDMASPSPLMPSRSAWPEACGSPSWRRDRLRSPSGWATWAAGRQPEALHLVFWGR